jgi:hypothetical protein
MGCLTWRSNSPMHTLKSIAVYVYLPVMLLLLYGYAIVRTPPDRK